MRDFGVPPLVEAPRSGGLADTVYDVAVRDPDMVQLARRAPGASTWTEVTAGAFRDEVMALAKGLLASGVRFGDRVGIMARTRYEWTLFSYALWSMGAQVVPIYPTSSSEQVSWILADSQAVACVVENEDDAMTVGTACAGLPTLQRIWQFDGGCVRQLSRLGRQVPDETVHSHRAAVEPHSPAAITYTSGTTGRPKGCVITHANFAVECDTLRAGWGDLIAEPGEQPALLAFLPLAHVYGLMVQVYCMRAGVRLGHQAETAAAELLPALASFRPTFLFAVPYVFERIVSRARLVAAEAGRDGLFDKAMDVAVRYAEARQALATGEGPGPGPALRFRHRVYDRLVYSRLRAVLGGRVRHAVSGGSPLSRRLALALAGAGITVYDGYGLTETTGAVTGQPRDRHKFGTVGRPLPGCTIHIAPDGEIWVRGGVVFAGYLNDPEGTAEVLRDGWFATGDLGSLDDEGYLTITGRKKDVIITSSGKSVAPAVLEERVRSHPLISQCLVVGDNRPYVGALITLDPDALLHWQRVHQKQPAANWGAVADQDLQEEIQRVVVTANTAVSRSESIRAFRILPFEFSIGQGLLTPSLKLRRRAIVKAFAADIEELYTS
ncbi:long-chain fatty acid--CoA ligase [Streptacidiphilus sp. ASG 303]|uniref:AMP-dependent synthetase/ligase n=1 Tax=Streptomycetaceae TaxID=2062 RepID=UPI001E347DC2|nr:AMP-dependent synthetase/ligase [Streptacidiphilus sp. ASG 303]MCD0485192.1 long-chain fatty acid--CoA ligase [Streptacidiphilus sp. ASG 303]